MKTELKHINFSYQTDGGKEYQISLSYQLFGKELFTAPIILINHALTGNSEVSWKDAIVKAISEASKTIDYLSSVKILEQRAKMFTTANMIDGYERIYKSLLK